MILVIAFVYSIQERKSLWRLCVLCAVLVGWPQLAPCSLPLQRNGGENWKCKSKEKSVKMKSFKVKGVQHNQHIPTPSPSTSDERAVTTSRKLPSQYSSNGYFSRTRPSVLPTRPPPLSMTDQDVGWYAIALWLIQVSWPSCAPSQPNKGGRERSRGGLDAVWAAFCRGQNAGVSATEVGSPV